MKKQGRKAGLYQELAGWLDEIGFSYQAHPEHSLFVFGSQLRHGNVRCLLHAEDDDRRMLLLVTAPVNTPEHRRAAVGEFLHRLNWNGAQGFFTLDYDDGEVRFRTGGNCAQPLPPEAPAAVLGHGLNTMDLLLPSLLDVIGGRPPISALEQLEAYVEDMKRQAERQFRRQTEAARPRRRRRQPAQDIPPAEQVAEGEDAAPAPAPKARRSRKAAPAPAPEPPPPPAAPAPKAPRRKPKRGTDAG